MTAQRVVTDHEELDGVGQLTHPQLDTYVLSTPWLVVSGTVPPAARRLAAGAGVVLVDGGPGGQLVVGLQPGSTGSLSPVVHEVLPQLVHLSDDDGPRGSLWPSGMVRDTGPQPFPTASIWWGDSTRTKKVVEQVVVRNAMRLIVTSSWRAYAVDGTTVVDSYTDVITYSGMFETSRTRTQP